MLNNTSMYGIHGEADFGNLQSITADEAFGIATPVAKQQSAVSKAQDFVMKNKLMIAAAIIALVFIYRKRR